MRRPWPIAAPLLVLALTVLAAGCGNERGRVPEQRFDAGAPGELLNFPDAGMMVELPAGIRPVLRAPPAVFRLVLGEPLVSAFAYRRREVIPKRPRQVRAAGRRLTRAVKRRDPDFELARRRIIRVAGAPAVELTGEQTLARGLLRTRSVHVYKGRAEYVFELLSPPRRFREVDRGVFEPMLASARLTGRIQRKRD